MRPLLVVATPLESDVEHCRRDRSDAEKAVFAPLADEALLIQVVEEPPAPIAGKK